MRAALIEEAVAHETSDAMGVVTLIYDHHAGRISERLTELQHLHLNRVVTTTHVHLDARRCLEVILLRGPTRTIRELADSLIGTKGVETGRLVLTSAMPIPDRGPAKRTTRIRIRSPAPARITTLTTTATDRRSIGARARHMATFARSCVAGGNNARDARPAVTRRAGE